MSSSQKYVSVFITVNLSGVMNANNRCSNYYRRHALRTAEAFFLLCGDVRYHPCGQVACWDRSISTPDKNELNRQLRSSVWGWPLNPVVAVGERRMIPKISSFIVNIPCSMVDTLTAQSCSCQTSQYCSQ